MSRAEVTAPPPPANERETVIEVRDLQVTFQGRVGLIEAAGKEGH